MELIYSVCFFFWGGGGLGFFHSVRSEFTDDVYETAVGPIW
jgi:hypothetical protein